jgi:putative thioredoxin
VSTPSLPQNFGRAFDLSSLKKPAANSTPTQPGVAIEATPENLVRDFVSVSNSTPVVLLAWSARMPESVQVLEILNKLATDDGGTWRLGSVNLDKYPEMANALQVQALPFGIALIQEQGVPLFDAPHPEPQIRAVINKLLELAAQKGLKINGASAPNESAEPVMEPEELEAMAALEKGDYALAALSYKKWLSRKPVEKLAQIGLAQCELMIRISNLDSATILASAAADPTLSLIHI